MHATPADRQLVHCKDKRIKGYCGQGGCWTKSGDDHYCKKHRELRAQRQRKRRAKLKEAARVAA